MDQLTNCLKECAIKLDALQSADNRFCAWLTYSAHNECFVAGIDMYSIDSDTPFTLLKFTDMLAIGAIDKMHSRICEWEVINEVPFLGIIFE